MVKKEKFKKSTNIFIIGPIPKGIDSTLAIPSLFSKKGKRFVDF